MFWCQQDKEKNMHKLLVYGREFSPKPHRLFGDFENYFGQHSLHLGLSSCLRLSLRASLGPPLGPSGTASCPRVISPPGSGDMGEKRLPPKKNLLYKSHFFFVDINQQNKDNEHRINNLTRFENCCCIIRNFISNTHWILTVFFVFDKK